jgi:hypothetical protein
MPNNGRIMRWQLCKLPAATRTWQRSRCVQAQQREAARTACTDKLLRSGCWSTHGLLPAFCSPRSSAAVLQVAPALPLALAYNQARCAVPTCSAIQLTPRSRPLTHFASPLQSVQPGRWLAVADEAGCLRILEPSSSDQPPAAAVVASWGAHSNSIFDVAWAKVGRRQSCPSPPACHSCACCKQPIHTMCL